MPHLHAFENLQGWWLHNFLGQPVSVLDNTLSEEIFLPTQSKPLTWQSENRTSFQVMWVLVPALPQQLFCVLFSPSLRKPEVIKFFVKHIETEMLCIQKSLCFSFGTKLWILRSGIIVLWCGVRSVTVQRDEGTASQGRMDTLPKRKHSVSHIHLALHHSFLNFTLCCLCLLSDSLSTHETNTPSWAVGNRADSGEKRWGDKKTSQTFYYSCFVLSASWWKLNLLKPQIQF